MSVERGERGEKSKRHEAAVQTVTTTTTKEVATHTEETESTGPPPHQSLVTQGLSDPDEPLALDLSSPKSHKECEEQPPRMGLSLFLPLQMRKLLPMQVHVLQELIPFTIYQGDARAIVIHEILSFVCFMFFVSWDTKDCLICCFDYLDVLIGSQ